MDDIFVSQEDDGSQWVQLEDYESLKKTAIENKLIVENIMKLLGVFTSTAALEKIIEMQNALKL